MTFPHVPDPTLRSFAEEEEAAVVRASNRDALTTRRLSGTDRNRQRSFLTLGNNIPEFFTVGPRISQIKEKQRRGNGPRRGEKKKKVAEALHHGELKMMIGGKRAANVDGGAPAGVGRGEGNEKRGRDKIGRDKEEEEEERQRA